VGALGYLVLHETWSSRLETGDMRAPQRGDIGGAGSMTLEYKRKLLSVDGRY
jgi:hypothetical protein